MTTTKHRRPHGSGGIEARGDRRWLLRWDAGLNPDGSRLRRSRTVRGTKKQAHDELQKELQRVAQGIDAPPTRMTVGEWCREWIDQHAATSGIRDSTARSYREQIETHIIPAIGGVRLRDLRPTHVRRLHAEARKTIAVSTLGQVHKVLSAALADAQKLGLVSTNAARTAGSPGKASRTKRPRRVLTVDELAKLLPAADETRNGAQVRVMLGTGLRVSETQGLQWDDLDLDAVEPTLRVERKTYWLGKGRGFAVNETKTEAGRRVLTLSPVLVAILKRHHNNLREQQLAAGPLWLSEGWVFADERGALRGPPMFAAALARIAKAAGLEEPMRVQPHVLRHSYASHALRNGADLFAVSRRLGHASPSLTLDVYRHEIGGEQREAAQVLDGLLGVAEGA